MGKPINGYKDQGIHETVENEMSAKGHAWRFKTTNKKYRSGWDDIWAKKSCTICGAEEDDLEYVYTQGVELWLCQACLGTEEL